MSAHYGATHEEWVNLELILGLREDLLPVISNSNAAISPASTIKTIGKVPSRYNHDRKAVGFFNWPKHKATSKEVDGWLTEVDYGICLQTRHVRALDVDVADFEKANEIDKFIIAYLEGLKLPRRYRSNSGKFLNAFRLEGQYAKRVLETSGGNIEFLGNGQQFIAHGMHPSGVRYEWDWSNNIDFPALSSKQFENLWAALVGKFGVSPSIESQSNRKLVTQGEAGAFGDPILKQLDVLKWGKDGRAHIRCPFEAEHTTGEAGDTSTTYFPTGMNGYNRGSFVCLHAHCKDRSQLEFANILNIDASALVALLDKGDYQRFTPVPASDFINGPAPSWLIKDLMPNSGLAMIFGKSGSGKSFFALDMAASIARGIPFCDKTVKSGMVIYVVAEGAHGFRNRLKAYAQHHGVSLGNLPLAIIDETPDLRADDDKLLIEAVKQYGETSMIVFDTFAQVIAGADENSGKDMGEILKRCKNVHQKTDSLVVLVHHTGKDEGRGARGWSGIRAAMDTEIEIAKCTDGALAKVTKQKDGEEGSQFLFKLKQVALGQDPDQNEIRSCVVEFLKSFPLSNQEAPTKKPKYKGMYQNLVIKILEDDLTDDGMSTEAIFGEVIKRIPYIDDGKGRDRRKECAKRALYDLLARAEVVVEGSIVKLPLSSTSHKVA